MLHILVFSWLAWLMEAGEVEFLPLPGFGAEVKSLHVSDLVRRSRGSPEEQMAAQDEVKQLRQALHANGVLAFRGLGKVPWQDQVALSAMFGTVFNESAHSNRAPHPAIPDDHVALFSNNPQLGSAGAGTEGWHVDGNVVPLPHAVTFIHALSAVAGGDTMFVPLREVVQWLRKNGYLRSKCVERAPPCIGSAVKPKFNGLPLDDVFFRSGHVDVRHPLIYPHPVTGQDTMVFGLGNLSGIYMKGCLQPALPTPVALTQQETDAVTEVIQRAVEGVSSSRLMRWRWASGDMLVVDNLAVAHHASDGTQASWEDVGVRLMQRTTVKGTNTPQKRPYLYSLPHECIIEQDDHYCVFSLASVMMHEPGQFVSREGARERCREMLSPTADLAIPLNSQRNEVMGRVVSSVGSPHWIGGDDYPNGFVRWLDGSSAEEGWESNSAHPWHQPSGQPNDCDGPGSETCMFMGPDGNWFDFACQAKMRNKTSGVTPGPEIKWDGQTKREYDIYPLCSLKISADETSMLGLRVSV